MSCTLKCREAVVLAWVQCFVSGHFVNDAAGTRWISNGKSYNPASYAAKERCSRYFFHSQLRWEVRSLPVPQRPAQNSQWGRPAWNDIRLHQCKRHTFDVCHRRKSGREEHDGYQSLWLMGVMLCSSYKRRKDTYKPRFQAEAVSKIRSLG